MVSERCACSRALVDIEVVEEAACDVSAGRPQPRAVRLVVSTRNHEQELGEGQVGHAGSVAVA